VVETTEQQVMHRAQQDVGLMTTRRRFADQLEHVMALCHGAADAVV